MKLIIENLLNADLFTGCTCTSFLYTLKIGSILFIENATTDEREA